MLNYLWSFMILVGMLWGAVNGNLDQVTQCCSVTVAAGCQTHGK